MNSSQYSGALGKLQSSAVGAFQFPLLLRDEVETLRVEVVERHVAEARLVEHVEFAASRSPSGGGLQVIDPAQRGVGEPRLQPLVEPLDRDAGCDDCG